MEDAPIRRYREWAAPGALGDTTTCLWASSGSAGTFAVRPDGCLDLIWIDGSLLVAGPDTTTKFDSPTGPAVGLRFRPGRAAVGLGAPPAELLDGRFPLADLWGEGAARRLAERLADAPSAEVAGAVLADAVARRPTSFATDPVAVAAVDLIVASEGRVPVATLADRVGVGERQLRRRVIEAVGYGPKLLGRVMRFRSALERIEGSSAGLAEVAAASGYADQAHLTREVSALAGSTPARLRADSFKTGPVPSGA